MVIKKRVLITGGAGFIGSHIARELLKRNYEVVIFDNFMRSKEDNIKDLIDTKDLKIVRGDIRNFDEINRAMHNVDFVFHEAADNIRRSLAYPQESFDINVIGSSNVIESCLRNNIKKLIFASSASVYGNPKKLPMKEDDELNPITPYCISKRTVEDMIKFYSTKGLKYNILRYFNVYGENQNVDAYYTSVIIVFIKRILNNEQPIIDGDGSQTMDFVHIKDIVQANILALEKDVDNEIFNVASGTQTSIKELAHILIKALNKDLEPKFNPRKVIVNRRQADISKIKKLLGYKVTVFPEEGLLKVAKHISENIDLYIN